MGIAGVKKKPYLCTRKRKYWAYMIQQSIVNKYNVPVPKIYELPASQLLRRFL